MKKNIGYVESVYLGSSEKDVDKSNCQSLNAQLLLAIDMVFLKERPGKGTINSQRALFVAMNVNGLPCLQKS
jgi:hypothetical protein